MSTRAIPSTPRSWHPTMREPAIDLALESSRGGTRWLSEFRGRVVVLIWEDRAHQSENAILKDELSAMARDARWSRELEVVAVGDVKAYDFAGARVIVRTAITTIANAIGVEILFDWRAALAAPPFSLTRGESNVMLLDRGGRPLARWRGSLPERDQRALAGAVRALLVEGVADVAAA